MKVGEAQQTEIFVSSLDTLYAMLKFIKEKCEEIGFTNTITSKIELAAEEALVNIISHGYPDSPGKIEIIVEKSEKPGIKITLIDSGIPFNPIDTIKKFNPKNIDITEEIGGYGIYFIVNMMDSVDYQRVENKNILTLVKFLAK